VRYLCTWLLCPSGTSRSNWALVGGVALALGRRRIAVAATLRGAALVAPRQGPVAPAAGGLAPGGGAAAAAARGAPGAAAGGG